MKPIRYSLVLLITLAILSDFAHAQNIIGVWKTVDASDAVGRQQKGVVFRKDGTGEFISPTTSDISEEWRKLLETITAGSTNMKFNYTLASGVVAITVTHYGGLPVSSSNTVQWKAENLSANKLKLSAEDSSGKWIVFEKI